MPYTLVHSVSFFFFNDPATTEIYTLSLHDALPISFDSVNRHFGSLFPTLFGGGDAKLIMTGEEILDAGIQNLLAGHNQRSEEHTSELQSPDHLVCRLLLEKKN